MWERFYFDLSKKIKIIPKFMLMNYNYIREEIFCKEIWYYIKIYDYLFEKLVG